MKDLIKNDDAVSVVVGAILVLAVLVTFMSVVTSSWVPIYEGNAESAHSDDTHKAFMDIHKQIELADEFTKSVSIDLGTEEMQFIQNSNSVGYLEVNESDGELFVIGNITRQSDAWGEGFEIVGMNTNDTAPFTNFSFEFTQLYAKSIDDGNIKLNNNFMVKIWTTELSRWITLYPTDLASNNFYSESMGIWVSYDANPQREIWRGESSDLAGGIINVSHPDISINLLTNDKIMKLIEPPTLTINTTTYNNTDTGEKAPLNDVIQHYMRLPGDGTGGTYNIDYVQYDGILDATQYITYKTTDESVSMIAGEGSNIKIMLDNFKVGGGTLKLQSDYNFMVDQSYIFDSGAVILHQYDGDVFKTDPPIYVDIDNSDRKLTLTLKSTVLKGEYQASGNGIETLYTALDGNMYEVSGVTDNITIVKNTTTELYPLWNSYFSKLKDEILDPPTIYNCTNLSNSSINQVGMIINSTNPDITITIQKKVITIS